jgi:hypothetical protein
MVRQKNFKYVYVHNGGTQLFDLEKDPKELNNLSGKVEFADIEKNLKSIIMNTFDPQAIAHDVIIQQRNCLYIDRAMAKSPRKQWKYCPNTENR